MTYYGGYANEANWLFPALPDSSAVLLYPTANFPDDIPLIFDGEITPTTCAGSTSSDPEIQHQGMMLGGLTALYDATTQSGGTTGLDQTASYYLTIACNQQTSG